MDRRERGEMEQLGLAEVKVEKGDSYKVRDEALASGGVDFRHLANTFQDPTMCRILGLEAQ